MERKNERKVAVIFPGQGSQEKGMGRDVAEKYSDVMDLWKKAEKISKAELRGIYWDGDEEEMKKTKYLQPAMTVVGLGLWYAISKENIEVDGVAGHSLGEYTALGASKVLSTTQLLKLVCLRGRLMDEVDSEGAMAAILKLDEKKVKELVEEVKKEIPGTVLCIANYNSPSQFVVSGNKKAVDILSSKVKALKARAVPLAVSGAFHSNLMKEANDELTKFMDKLSWQDAKIPVYLNVNGKPETNGFTIAQIMKKQMVSSVMWIQLVLNQFSDGFRDWIELGPKGILSRLVKQILKGKKDIHITCISKLDVFQRKLN